MNGAAVLNVKQKVHAGIIIQYRADDVKEPHIDEGFCIIFEDENYIAINKTGNLPVHPSGIFFNNTLVSILERQYDKKFLPIHRLDRETSGAILLGKNKEAASFVQNAFENVSKGYTAIVRGAVKEKSFIVDVPLGQARNSFIRKKREAFPGAPEKAFTQFDVSSISSDKSFSLVNAMPVTGRTHQIRAHLCYAGHPIIGDKIYGTDEGIYLRYIKEGDSDELKELAGFNRCALHSSYIKFYHPYEKKDIKIIAPLLPDMAKFINDKGL